MRMRSKPTKASPTEPCRDASTNHNHQKVNHSAKEWVRGAVHTGTIDGYWGLLKRGVIGTLPSDLREAP